MSAILDVSEPQGRFFSDEIPPLENGDHLSAAEFLRRYEAMPDVKKAELINGIVYMTASSVRIDQHAEPDGMIQGWLFTYAMTTPGVRHATNATMRLGNDVVSQPDALLRLLSDFDGQTKRDESGYLLGAPELVVEVTASSASIDTREKLAAFQRAGVQEYIVWRTRDHEVDWWMMEDRKYTRRNPDHDSILRSHLFPGLWLNVPALIEENAAKMIATLHSGMTSASYVAFKATLESRVKAQSAA